MSGKGGCTATVFSSLFVVQSNSRALYFQIRVRERRSWRFRTSSSLFVWNFKSHRTLALLFTTTADDIFQRETAAQIFLYTITTTWLCVSVYAVPTCISHSANVCCRLQHLGSLAVADACLCGYYTGYTFLHNQCLEFVRICGFCLSTRFLRIHCKFSVGSVQFPGHGSRILMLLSPSHLVTTFLLTSLLLIFCPTAPHVCQSIGGSLSGGSGAPPPGHHVSAASTCPPEEVCNLKVHVIG